MPATRPSSPNSCSSLPGGSPATPAASLADCAGHPGLRHHAAPAGPGPFSSSCLAAATAGNCSVGTAIMPTARPPRQEDMPLRSRRSARGYRSPPGTAFCAVRAVIQQSAGIGSSDCSGTGVPGAGRGQASYLLSASTRRSMSSSTLPDLGSCRLASWSLSSALVRPS